MAEKNGFGNLTAKFEITGVISEVRPLRGKEDNQVWAHAITVSTMGEKFDVISRGQDLAHKVEINRDKAVRLMGNLVRNGFRTNLELSEVIMG